MRVRARSIKGVAVEDIRIAFENRLTDDAIICSVHSQNKGRDRVATVGSLRRITIGTRLSEIHTDERIGRTFADSCMDRILNRFDDIELNTPEERFFVDHRLIMIQTGSLQIGSIARPMVDPCERKIIRADYSNSINQRMNH